MKRFSFIYSVLAVGCALLLSSCQDRVQMLSGSYSYKISGTAEIDDEAYRLNNEQGAMEMVRLTGDTVLLTFNALAADAYHTQAVIENKQITLAPYNRDIMVNGELYHITATGKGTVYDGTIIMALQYRSANGLSAQLEVLCKKN